MMKFQDSSIINRASLKSKDLDAVLSCVVETAEDFDLVLLEMIVGKGNLRISLDAANSALSLDDIAAAAKAISARLDDLRGIAYLDQRYELEVSSPGIERPLLNLAHFERAVGSLVEVVHEPLQRSKIKTIGRLAEVSSSGLVLHIDKERKPRESLVLSFDEIESARTVFEWPAKRPGGAPHSDDVDDTDEMTDALEDEDDGTN